MKRVSLGIVIAALAVSAPRLTLAFLIGDGIVIPEQVEIAILTTTGVASGVVLTVGNAVLAHALASKAHQRGALWWINALAWLLFLVGAVVIVAPTLVTGMQRSTLAQVLVTAEMQWMWAVTAVVIIELLVGAAMAAAILADESQPQLVEPLRATTSRWGKLLDAATDRAVEGLRPRPAETGVGLAAFNPAFNGRSADTSHQAASVVQATVDDTPKRLDEAEDGLADPQVVLADLSPTELAALHQFQLDPKATYQHVAEVVGVTKGTISNYIKKFKPLGLVQVSKQQGVVVIPDLELAGGV